ARLFKARLMFRFFGFGKKLPKVLLVDDDRFARTLVSNFLKDESFSLVTARDGHQGLSAALRERPALILLDASMPGKDGWQLLSSLKADGRTSAIPVLMCTAVNDVASMDRAFQEGAEGYITKPIQRDELLRKVRKALGAPPPEA